MVKDAGTKIAEQKRKISRFINAMTDAEARAFLERGHTYRRALMVEKLGVWGQTAEDIAKKKAGVKLGILKGWRW